MSSYFHAWNGMNETAWLCAVRLVPSSSPERKRPEPVEAYIGRHPAEPPSAGCQGSASGLGAHQQGADVAGLGGVEDAGQLDGTRLVQEAHRRDSR